MRWHWRTVGLVLGLLCTGGGCNRLTSESPVSSADGSTQSGAAVASPVIPMVTTPAADLEPPGYTETMVLKIVRDFGEENFQIALDAWVPKADPERIEEVRLWWLKIASHDERGPFSEKTKRHFDIVYEHPEPAHWIVKMISDRKTFTFDVELDGKGTPVALGTVILPGGKRVERCHVTSAEILARRFLGAPIGIKRLEVTCTDPEGNELQGRLLQHE